jgi:hypothetical protein
VTGQHGEVGSRIGHGALLWLGNLDGGCVGR